MVEVACATSRRLLDSPRQDSGRRASFSPSSTRRGGSSWLLTRLPFNNSLPISRGVGQFFSTARFLCSSGMFKPEVLEPTYSRRSQRHQPWDSGIICWNSRRRTRKGYRNSRARGNGDEDWPIWLSLRFFQFLEELGSSSRPQDFSVVLVRSNQKYSSPRIAVEAKDTNPEAVE